MNFENKCQKHTEIKKVTENVLKSCDIDKVIVDLFCNFGDQFLSQLD